MKLMEVMQAVERRQRFSRDTPEAREAFRRVYKGCVMDALNIRRSNCDQTGGKIVHRYMTMCCDGNDDPNLVVNFFTLDSLCKLRRSITQEEKTAFRWFFGEFLDCVCGRRSWGHHKYHDLISEAVNRDTGTAVVTVSDEAFGLLLLETYLEKWKKKFYAKRKGEVIKGKLDGVYTASSKGNYEFGGWSRAAMKKFTYYCNLVKEDRGSTAAHNMEVDFLTHMQQTPEGTRIHEKLQLANAASQRRGQDDDDESECEVFMEPLD
jgi:hypothetical protein